MLRPRTLTPEENFAIMSTAGEHVRRRAERESPREEAMGVPDAFTRPTPGDPFGHTEGFADDGVRLSTSGSEYIELSDVVGNSAARKHLRAEMMRIRTANRNPRHMRRWGNMETPTSPT